MYQNHKNRLFLTEYSKNKQVDVFETQCSIYSVVQKSCKKVVKTEANLQRIFNSYTKTAT